MEIRPRARRSPIVGHPQSKNIRPFGLHEYWRSSSSSFHSYNRLTHSLFWSSVRTAPIISEPNHPFSPHPVTDLSNAGRIHLFKQEGEKRSTRNNFVNIPLERPQERGRSVEDVLHFHWFFPVSTFKASVRRNQGQQGSPQQRWNHPTWFSLDSLGRSSQSLASRQATPRANASSHLAIRQSGTIIQLGLFSTKNWHAWEIQLDPKWYFMYETLSGY